MFSYDLFLVRGGEEWVADSGATFHVTRNLFGMVNCTPSPPGKSSSVVGDMRSLKVGYFGHIPTVMHSSRCDVPVRLVDTVFASTCFRFTQ